VKREHGVGRESRHTPYINRRAACGSSDSLVVKMRCCERREAHKRGVQRDKEGMIERGVKSEGWCLRPLHTLCVAGGPGSLRASPSTIARTRRCKLCRRVHAPRAPSAGDLVPNLRCVVVCEAARPRLGMRTHIVPCAGMDPWIGRVGMERMGGGKK
jgi:hypothetical protein